MRSGLLTSASMLILMPEAVFAQATTAPAATGPAPSEQAASADQTPASGLGDIIVTAQRREENLQRAAVAVDVVQGADLVTAGVTQVDRLGELAPALTIQPTGTGNITFLRGVGNFTVSANSDPAIAFNYDGVYVGRPSSQTGVFFDLERIEILKGPQGTLYGRNATGGAINVIPVQPRLGELSGYATASYGNYDAITAEGAVNAPLGANGALRISGSVARRDGYLRDGTSDERTESLRVQLKSELTPALTVRVAGDYSHTGGVGAGVSYIGNYLFNPAAGGYLLIPSGVPVADGQYTPAGQAYRTRVPAGTAGRFLDPLERTPFQQNDFLGTNAEISYDTGAGVLTIVPAWRYASLNFLAAPSFLYRNREKDEQFSLEARFEGTRIGIFDYTIGGYVYDEKIKSRLALSLSSAVTFQDVRYKTRSYAPFGRVTAHLTDQLRLVGGVRYTDDKKRFSGTTTAGAIVCLNFVNGIPTCPNAPLFPLTDRADQIPFAFPPPGVPVLPLFSGGVPTGAIVVRTDRNDDSRLKNNKVTYRAAVEFDVAERSLFYASFETGYRSGGFSAAEGFETFQPETIDAFTVGLKNRFFDNRVQLNIEGFYWNYKDQQVNYVGLDLAGRTANFTQNIGKSRIKGVEVEGQFLLTPTTLLSGDVQYLDARNRVFAYQQAVGVPGAPPPLTGCDVSVNANPLLYDVDCAGRPSYNSPKWTVNLAAQQTIEIGDYKLVGGVNTQYKSRRAIGFQYLDEQTIGSNWRTDAQLAFGPADDRWSLSAYVRNLENNRIPIYSSLNPIANILINGTTAPRTYGVRGSVKF